MEGEVRAQAAAAALRSLFVSESRSCIPPRPIRFAALVVAIAGLHLVAAAYAWHLLPHGFPPTHPRFWVNEVLPFTMVASSAACIVGVWRRRERVTAVALSLFPGLHAGIAVGWLVVFPVTGQRVATLAGVAAVVLALCAVGVLGRARSRWIAAGAAIGVAVGIGVARAQRGPEPATHPAERVRALSPLATGELPAWVQAGTRAVRLTIGGVQIDVSPLLTFTSRSPDRGWTVFADQRPRDDVHGVFGVTSVADNRVHIEAETVIPDEVYSHLNTFCTIQITGHHRLFVAFSPMVDQRIEVTYSEYPTGKPSRFAFIDKDSDLHVVQSSTGEKGPFTELARGHLPAGAPLGITLFDEDRPIATLELADFATQASTQLSPTAGWRAPENAIELTLGWDRPDAPAVLFITLAGTSVGRGWDSVGHAPGLYRNRIDVKR